MSFSSGSGYGCCLDPHVIDHMTWSVNGVVSARILAPSPGGPSGPRMVCPPPVTEWSGLEGHLEAHEGIMDREILGDGIKLGAVGPHRTGMPRILHSGRESGSAALCKACDGPGCLACSDGFVPRGPSCQDLLEGYWSGSVGVQRAHVVLACLEQKDGWFGLRWEWDRRPVKAPAVAGVASAWAGVLGRRPGLGAAAWCTLWGWSVPRALSRGLGSLEGGVDGTGPEDHFWPPCGVPRAVPQRTQLEQGHRHLDQPGVTWGHVGTHPGRACPGTRCSPSPLGGPGSCGTGRSCRGRCLSNGSPGKRLSLWGP